MSSLFNQYLEAVIKPKKIFHISSYKIKSLTNEPMFFALTEKDANEYAKLKEEEYGDAYIYKGLLTDGKFLSDSDLKLSGTFLSNLLSNLSKLEKMKMIKPLKDKCDGFYHKDYDPSNSSKEIDVIFIFDPSKSITDWKIYSEK